MATYSNYADDATLCGPANSNTASSVAVVAAAGTSIPVSG